MSETKNVIREHLLGETAGALAGAAYRENINRILHENEVRLGRQRILAAVAWIFCVAMATIWIWTSHATEKGPFLAGVFMIVGAVEVVKHRIEASRVQLTAELKQLQVQLFDLELKYQRGE